jgi:hypothetical protein
MNKKFILLFIIVLSCAIAATYGIVYDCMMYNFCPEFYTKFKFTAYDVLYNRNLWPLNALIKVGLLASWWMGLIIGTMLGVMALALPTLKILLPTVYKAMGIVIGITFALELCGLAYGWFFLRGDTNNWLFYLPEDVVQQDRFLMSMSMHNFSYVGAIIGMLAGSIFIISKKRNLRSF